MANHSSRLFALLTVLSVPGAFASTGDKISIAQAPWSLSLRSADYYHGCGATLIAPRWLITAGHCVDWLDEKEPVANQLSAWGGASNLKKLRALPAIKAVYLAPGYVNEVVVMRILKFRVGSYLKSVNDIGLIELESDADLSAEIGDGQHARVASAMKAIPLGTSVPKKDTALFFSGWGSIPGGLFTSRTKDGVGMDLRGYSEKYAGDTEVLQQLKANDEYYRDVHRLEEQTDILVTYTSNTICQGDSGSALSTITADGSAELTAVVSGGEEACSKSGLKQNTFTRIAPFRAWITKLTGLR